MSSRIAPAHLPRDRAAARISAYVYGNILVLGAVAVARPEDVEDLQAVTIVLGTALTTYAAHVLAHLVGGSVTSDSDGGHHDRDALRDAAPILTSAIAPALVLLVGPSLDVPVPVVHALAAASVVLRLAGMRFLIDRVVGRRPGWTSLGGGLWLAVVSSVIVALKLVLTH